MRKVLPVRDLQDIANTGTVKTRRILLNAGRKGIAETD